jgi:predicted 2-oxoglutarate/Fe(II)-dependent dioxygenase YbiX
MIQEDLGIDDTKIHYYRDLIPKNLKIIDLINSVGSKGSLIGSWSEWKSSGNSPTLFGDLKKINYHKYKESTIEEKYLYDIIFNAISMSAENYSEKNNLTLKSLIPPLICKYHEGTFMGPHTDDSQNAYISGVLYLNDDYEGGELEFPNYGLSIKPEAGSMIIFPSTHPYIHDPKPAYGSERYICPVFWYK